MAKNRGWWDLELQGIDNIKLSDCDREHIAKCIIEGYEGGEIVEEED